MAVTNDYANYRKMSEPHASPEEADQALMKFYLAVQEARRQTRITEVYVIVKFNVVGTEGSEGAYLNRVHFGNELEGLPMCAWAYGQEQAEFKEKIGKLLK